MHFFSMGVYLRSYTFTFSKPIHAVISHMGVHLEIPYGYCLYILFLGPPGCLKGHSCDCSYFKKDMLTVVRRDFAHVAVLLSDTSHGHRRRKWFILLFLNKNNLSESLGNNQRPSYFTFFPCQENIRFLF